MLTQTTTKTHHKAYLSTPQYSPSHTTVHANFDCGVAKSEVTYIHFGNKNEKKELRFVFRSLICTFDSV